MDALCRLIKLALKQPAMRTGPFQSALLNPLLDLWRSKYDDSKEGILVGVLHVLQSSGHTLGCGGPAQAPRGCRQGLTQRGCRAGWNPVLELLDLVPRGTFGYCWRRSGACCRC